MARVLQSSGAVELDAVLVGSVAVRATMLPELPETAVPLDAGLVLEVDVEAALLLAGVVVAEDADADPELFAAVLLCVFVEDVGAAVTLELVDALTGCEALGGGEAAAELAAVAVLGPALAAVGALMGAAWGAGVEVVPPLAGEPDVGAAPVCPALAGAVGAAAALGLVGGVAAALLDPVDVVLLAVDGELAGAAEDEPIGCTSCFATGLREIVSFGGADWLD